MRPARYVALGDSTRSPWASAIPWAAGGAAGPHCSRPHPPTGPWSSPTSPRPACCPGTSWNGRPRTPSPAAGPGLRRRRRQRHPASELRRPRRRPTARPCLCRLRPAGCHRTHRLSARPRGHARAPRAARSPARWPGGSGRSTPSCTPCPYGTGRCTRTCARARESPTAPCGARTGSTPVSAVIANSPSARTRRRPKRAWRPAPPRRRSPNSPRPPPRPPCGGWPPPVRAGWPGAAPTCCPSSWHLPPRSATACGETAGASTPGRRRR